MKKTSLLLSLGASAAALSVALPTVSVAAEGDIVVTAQRRSESLKNVPMSVNVATGEQLEDLNILDTKDISQLAPGLEISNTTGRNNTTTIRGIGFDPDQGTAPTVQVYWNEAPVDAQTVYTALYDIKQIEVLRGPQGLLRGLSSPGGAITVATRRGNFDNKLDGRIQATGTDRAAYNIQGGVSIPVSDVFSIRLAGLMDENRGNNVRNVTNGDRSKVSTDSARATLGFRPNDNFEAFLTYQYLKSKNRQYAQVFGPGGVPDGFNPSGPGAVSVEDRIAVSDGIMEFENESQFLNLNARWNIGFATLEGLASYQRTDLDSLRDQDTANAIPGYAPLQHTTTPYRVPAFELRMTSNGDSAFGWGLGAFHSKQTGKVNVDQRSDSFFAPVPYAFGLFLPVSTHVFVPVESETTSFNANASYRSGAFALEGGLRYSILKQQRVSDITVTSPGYAPFFIPGFTQEIEGIPAALKNQKDEPWTGGVTARYELNPDLAAYASYGHSFRAGSVGVAVPAGLSNDLLVTKGEKTDSFEIGLKGYALDRRIGFDLAVFNQKIDGFLSRFTGIYYNCPNIAPGVCSPFGAPINNAADAPDGSFDFNANGDATVRGVELTLNTRPTDNWDVNLNLAYAHARFKKGGSFPCNDFDGDGTPDATGAPTVTGTGNVSYCSANRLADVPDFSLSANTEYRFPPVLGSEIVPFTRALVTYRPGVTSEFNNFHYDTLTNVNLYAGLRNAASGWELSVFAKNLFDDEKITNISSGNGTVATPAGAYDSGYRVINSTTPREIGVTVSYAFGN